MQKKNIDINVDDIVISNGGRVFQTEKWENQYGGMIFSPVFIHKNDLEQVWRAKKVFSQWAFTLKNTPFYSARTA